MRVLAAARSKLKLDEFPSCALLSPCWHWANVVFSLQHRLLLVWGTCWLWWGSHKEGKHWKLSSGNTSLKWLCKHASEFDPNCCCINLFFIKIRKLWRLEMFPLKYAWRSVYCVKWWILSNLGQKTCIFNIWSLSYEKSIHRRNWLLFGKGVLRKIL